MLFWCMTLRLYTLRNVCNVVNDYDIWINKMSNYLRYRVPGGCYFFTVNLLDRKKHLLIEHIDLLRHAFQSVKQQHPFHIDAIVILPEHLHCIMTLPEGDDNFSTRWQAIKKKLLKTTLCD